MIDKLLKAARTVVATATTGPQVNHRGAATPRRGLINVVVEDFETLTLVARDYFNPGRSDATCDACGAPLLWVETPRGKKAPLDACPIEGLDRNGEHHRIHLSHFATCPHAADFGKSREPSGNR